jgi:hypothetical protein
MSLIASNTDVNDRALMLLIPTCSDQNSWGDPVGQDQPDPSFEFGAAKAPRLPARPSSAAPPPVHLTLLQRISETAP